MSNESLFRAFSEAKGIANWYGSVGRVVIRETSCISNKCRGGLVSKYESVISRV